MAGLNLPPQDCLLQTIATMAARGSKLNDPATVRAILDNIREGNYMIPSAIAAGVPKDTFFYWIRKGKKARSGKHKRFYDAVQCAKAEAELELVKKVKAHGATEYKAILEMLARRFPDRWAKREKVKADITLTGKDGGPVEIVVVDVEDAHSDSQQEAAPDTDSEELI